MDFGKEFSAKVINDGKWKVVSEPIEILMIAHHYLHFDSITAYLYEIITCYECFKMVR